MIQHKPHTEQHRFPLWVNSTKVFSTLCFPFRPWSFQVQITNRVESFDQRKPKSCAFITWSVSQSASRWVKFEEKVEEGGERWSKPHVSTLSLHSLFELRTCLQTGTVLLDLEGYSLPQIVGEMFKTTDSYISNGVSQLQYIHISGLFI